MSNIVLLAKNGIIYKYNPIFLWRLLNNSISLINLSQMAKDLLFRCIALVVALAQPIIILLYNGVDTISISSMWGTDLQPLFILTNAMTSYFFFQTKHWIIPSVFLLLLTAFSVNMYPILHNILAVSFFLSVFYPLYKVRDKMFLILYACSIPFLLLSDFFWMECWAIYIICAYHLKNLYIFWKYEHRKILT